MKINKLINSFKAGLMSPLMRSRLDNKEVNNACETLENFHVHSLGGAERRMGLQAKSFSDKTTPSAFTFLFDFPAYVYMFNIEGEDFYFVFNQNEAINSSESRSINNDTAFFPAPAPTSKFLRIFDSNGIEYRVRSFGATGESAPFSTFNGFNDGSSQNEFSDYLGNIFYNRLNYTQLSAKTVIFCDPDGAKIPFYVTRDFIPDTYNGTKQTHKQFIIAPWCVDYSQLSRTYEDTRYVPLSPNVVPYGVRNTNNNYTLGISDIYAGVEPTSGTRYLVTGTPHTQKWMKIVSIPRQLMPSNYTAGAPAGMWFKAIQIFDGKECAGFAHTYYGQNSTHISFYASFSVGGDYAVDTTDFALSIWSNLYGMPKCVNVHRGILNFGNAGVEKNGIYFSAINLNNLAGFQNFMQSVLYQDASTDFSGIRYFDSSVKTNRGFNILLNEGKTEEIKWLFSRRNLHIGTGNGEHQLVFTEILPQSDKFYVNRIGSTQSVNVQPIEGDRKIFYVSDSGKVIRLLSTENKDYESVDLEITNYLYRLDSPVVKLQWCEPIRALLALCEDSTVYAITISEINDTLAASIIELDYANFVTSDIITHKRGYDLLATKTTLGFPNTYKTLIAGNYPELTRGVNLSAEKAKYLDLSITDVSGTTNIYDFLKIHAGNDISCYINNDGIEHIVSVPSGYVVGDPLTFLPAHNVGDTLSLGVRYMSQLVTFPIEDGSKHGSPIGDVKRIDRATIMLYESGKCEMGNPDSSIYDVEGLSNTAYNTTNANMDFPDSPDTVVKVIVRTDEPVPLTIIGASFRMVDYEGE